MYSALFSIMSMAMLDGDNTSAMNTGELAEREEPEPGSAVSTTISG
jgi:hypothetical protein